MRSVGELVSKKREAVRLRLNGLSLAQIKVSTGLSVPTIIKAVNLFKNQGWKGLESAERGRKSRTIQITAREKRAILLSISSCCQQRVCFCSVDELLPVYAKQYKVVSKKTLLRRLGVLLPERDQSVLFDRMARLIEKMKESDKVRANFLAKCKKLVLGFYELSEGCVFYTLDRRGERRFVFVSRSTSHAVLNENSLVAQLDRLVSDASLGRPFFVVIKTDSLLRYRQLSAWQEANRERCFLYAQWALPE